MATFNPYKDAARDPSMVRNVNRDKWRAICCKCSTERSIKGGTFPHKKGEQCGCAGGMCEDCFEGGVMFEFTSMGESFPITGRQEVVFVVENPADTKDFSELIGQQVTINGLPRIVKGVERFAHNPPWHAGERIGLLCDPFLEL